MIYLKDSEINGKTKSRIIALIPIIFVVLFRFHQLNYEKADL